MLNATVRNVLNVAFEEFHFSLHLHGVGCGWQKHCLSCIEGSLLAVLVGQRAITLNGYEDYETVEAAVIECHRLVDIIYRCCEVRA